MQLKNKKNTGYTKNNASMFTKAQLSWEYTIHVSFYSERENIVHGEIVV